MNVLRVGGLAKSALFVFAFSVAVLSGDIGQVHAEQDVGSRSLVIEEVIVTARKREESLQEVPVAVSAFSAEQLERQTIQEFIDVEAQIPGVLIQQAQQDPSIAWVSIRGQQQADYLMTTDSSVGAYVDNVNLPRQSGLNANMFDIERIEVLKGPQGTLYGRNTTGGAINIISRKADYEGRHGYLKVGIGNEAFTQLSGAVNVPFSDTAAARFAVQKTDQDGWGESRFSGTDLYDQDEIFLRASMTWDPSDRVNVQFQADYMDLDEGGAAEKILHPGGNFANGVDATSSLSAGVQVLGQPLAADFSNYAQLVLAGYSAMNEYVDGDLLKTDADADVFSKATLFGGGVTINFDISDEVQFKSITGYRNWETEQLLDLDGTPFFIIHPFLGVDADFISQELQLAGSSERLDWVVGGYYSHEEGVDGSTTIFVPNLSPSTSFTYGEVTNKSWALFGQVTYALNDRSNLTAGLRWTEETKELTNKNRAGSGLREQKLNTPSDAGVTCRVPGRTDLPVSQCSSDHSDSFNDPSWLISLDYAVSDQMMMYASVSSSWRGGGQNLRADGDIASAQPFAPETATSYEIGLKGDLADGLMRLNAAAYYVDYEDIQRSIIVPGVAGEGAVVTVLANAAEAEISGFEAEAWLTPSDNLSLFATVGYIDFEYGEFDSIGSDGVTVIDRSDEPVTLPDFQYSLSVRYDTLIAGNELGIQVDYVWTDEFTTDALSPAQEAVTRDELGRLNARIDWQFANDLTLSFWAKNITDEEFFVTTTDILSELGTVVSVSGRPRSYGLTLSKTFGNE